MKIEKRNGVLLIYYILAGAVEKEKPKLCSEREAGNIGGIVNILLTIFKIEDGEVKWRSSTLDKEKLIVILSTLTIC